MVSFSTGLIYSEYGYVMILLRILDILPLPTRNASDREDPLGEIFSDLRWISADDYLGVF
jgi:hypothetical protein